MKISDLKISGITIEVSLKPLKFSITKYTKGLWCMDGQSNFGFKLDLYLGKVFRPVPNIFRKSFWLNRPFIKDDRKALSKNVNELLEKKMILLKEIHKDSPPPMDGEWIANHEMNYGIYNPWKGNYGFVMNSFIRMPLIFFSFSTPIRSAYIGFKTYSVDIGDATWIGDCAISTEKGRAAAPSASMRKSRS